MNGTVKNVNQDKGFGFIIDTDKREYFFHRSALKNIDIDALKQGAKVTFDAVDSQKGPRAENVFAE